MFDTSLFYLHAGLISAAPVRPRPTALSGVGDGMSNRAGYADTRFRTGFWQSLTAIPVMPNASTQGGAT
jgi:hypothetical protein